MALQKIGDIKRYWYYYNFHNIFSELHQIRHPLALK